MKKVISFKSDKKHYNADACIVWCFDNRFGDLLSKFKKKFGLRYTDDLEIAGGAMNLVGYGSGENKTFVLDQVEKSIKLHKTPLVILMAHKDCGAYKALGLPIKRDNWTDLLKNDLNTAKIALAEYLENNGYKPNIQTYIAGFDGLWEV